MREDIVPWRAVLIEAALAGTTFAGPLNVGVYSLSSSRSRDDETLAALSSILRGSDRLAAAGAGSGVLASSLAARNSPFLK